MTMDSPTKAGEATSPISVSAGICEPSVVAHGTSTSLPASGRP